MQLTSSNFGSPSGSGSCLDGMGTRSGSTAEEKLDALLSQFVHFETQIAQISALRNWMSRMDSHITKTLGNFATRLTERDDTGTFIVPALNVRSQVRRNGVETNQCSNLLHLETDSSLILLLLICVFLVFLMMYYNRSSLQPAIWLRTARLMCDGHPFASSPFAAWRVEAPLFAVSLFGGLCKLRPLWFDA